MAFDARITISGLCLILRDQDKDPSQVEVILPDTESSSGGQHSHGHHGQEHRHAPVLALPYDRRGNLEVRERHLLGGWDTYVIAPNGDAFVRLSLANTISRFEATWEKKEPTRFTLDSTFDQLPDLRELDVNTVYPPSWNHRLSGATARISLPPGDLEMSNVAVDRAGKPIAWDKVGEIAELLHLKLTGLSDLWFSYGMNRFRILAPQTGDLVLLLSLTNEPVVPPELSSMFDSVTNMHTVPHFSMLGRLTNQPPQITKTGMVTPSTPVCPSGGWVDPRWPFLPRS